MQLTLNVHPVTDVRFGRATELDGTRLSINERELRDLILDDRRLESVDLAIARPGESCRVGYIFDILEPRAKAPGTGTDFPGILGPYAAAGEGTTHVLRGLAVTVLDEGLVAGGKFLEMSGPAADLTPYGTLRHLVVVPHADPRLPRDAVMNALKVASAKTAAYLGRAAIGQTAASTETYGIPGPRDRSREGLPRIAYIGQVHGHQHMMEPGDRILYGTDLIGAMPVPLHPNEWLDGGVVLSYWNNHPEETYLHQNHPIVLALYRQHAAGRINFVGTIAMAAASEETDRDRNCMIAANMAKWALGADGVVLNKYGGGAPHADMGETARLCERLGIRTAVMVSDVSGDRKEESALLFSYPEVDAIVSIGGGDTNWGTRVERVIAGSPLAAEALSSMRSIGARSVAGIANQQGAGRIRSVAF
jgi:glycine reductase